MILFIDKATNKIVGTQNGMKKNVLVSPTGEEDNIIWHVVDDSSLPEDRLLDYKFIDGEYIKE